MSDENRRATAQLRVSDADRDRTAGLLRTHLVEGRLDTREFEQRLHACLRARTLGELRALVGDLPRAAERRRPRPTRLSAAVAITGALAVVSIAGGGHFLFPAPLLFLAMARLGPWHRRRRDRPRRWADDDLIRA